MDTLPINSLRFLFSSDLEQCISAVCCTDFTSDVIYILYDTVFSNNWTAFDG